MHKEILTKEQIELLDFIKIFFNDFYLVSGTAIALQVGHRQSIDFDLFTFNEFENRKIRKEIQKHGLKIQRTFQDEAGQFNFLLNNVQFTFFQYPFKIKTENVLDKNIIKMPNLLTLAAMKAYTLGRRTKWKDYVDLYFIIDKFHGIDKIIEHAKDIFEGEFNGKVFREQLSYFNDVSFTEKINYLPDFEITDEELMMNLEEFSLL